MLVCGTWLTHPLHFFLSGRAAALISGTNNVANLTRIMNKIGAMCLATIGVWVTIELCVQFGHYHHACTSGVGEHRRVTHGQPSTGLQFLA